MRFRRRASALGAAIAPAIGFTAYLAMLTVIAIVSFALGMHCSDPQESDEVGFVPPDLVSTSEEAAALVEGRLLVDGSLTNDIGALESVVCGAVPGWPEFRLARFEPTSRSWIEPCELRFTQANGLRLGRNLTFFAVDSHDGAVRRLTVSGANRRATR